MKADEPHEPLVKFGMVESEQNKILERDVAVTADRRAIADYHFAHALVLAPVLRAAFDSIGKRAPDERPVVIVAALEAPAPDDLRASLGLS